MMMATLGEREVDMSETLHPEPRLAVSRTFGLDTLQGPLWEKWRVDPRQESKLRPIAEKASAQRVLPKSP